MLIGYARVSTKRQKLDLQRQALEAAGCELVIQEQRSGRQFGRGLLAAIGSCHRGDRLVVWKLDRLGRTIRELCAVLDLLRLRGIGLQVLTGAASAIDLGNAEGLALYTAYAAFAELELAMSHERTLAGLTARRAGLVMSQRRRRRLQPIFATVASGRKRRSG